MYCVIQKVTNKKPNTHGHYKELTVSSTSFGITGQPLKTKYSYRYGDERFERPIKDAYKISIHKSYRENGKVKKKQWVICTMSFYDIYEYSLYDCAATRIKNKTEKIGVTEDELYEMIYEKLDPLYNQIKKEFESTEEYKTKVKHDEILNQYRTAKSKFEEEYGSDTYDYCYDIFGTLQNKAYLEDLKFQKTVKEEYYKRSYDKSYQSNYNNYNFGGYSTSTGSNYTDEEKGMLKKFYRDLSKKYHPDVTNDDGSSMKFLTKLKEQWGI